LAGLSANLTAWFSDADLSLLASALYLQARPRVRAAKRPIGESGVRAVLARPIDISRFSHRSLKRTLTQTKARMARDARYRSDVDAAPAEIARWCWWQIIVIIIIIIIVVIRAT
jgi:hypothetical protein